MVETVKVDDRNRVAITCVKKHTNIDLEKGVAIHPNAITGLIYDPEATYEQIIDSLEGHIDHFKRLKRIEEADKKIVENEGKEEREE